MEEPNEANQPQRPEPIEFPKPEEEPFQQSRDFIAAMNRENVTYTMADVKPEIEPRSPVFGTLGETSGTLPEPEPVVIPEGQESIRHWTSQPDIVSLIDRVERVIMETPQMGTEPLSVKASTLAALYQAHALERMVRILGDVNQCLAELLGHLYSLTGENLSTKLDPATGESRTERTNYIRTGTRLNP